MTLQDAEGRDLHLLSTYCVSGTEQALLPQDVLCLSVYVAVSPLTPFSLPHYLLESSFPSYR